MSKIHFYRLIYVLGGAMLLLFGFGGGWWYAKHSTSNQVIDTRSAGIRERETGFHFISPLLAIRSLSELRSFQGLEQNITSYIANKKTAGDATAVSVYFQDLNTGRWFGVDETEKYALASTFKVPLMITMLKLAEQDPSLLSKKIVYTPPPNREPAAEPNTPRLKPGALYTIQELLQQMIVYSDNDAKTVLEAITTPEQRRVVFDDLGLQMPAEDNTGDSMTPRQFSLFFRVLYNASYLSRATSESALGVLSEINFKNGLNVGLPSGVAIAHKYGYRILDTEPAKQRVQLHDCGIIYHPQSPYLLCVSTKGSDYQTLANILHDISATVYQTVDQDYK